MKNIFRGTSVRNKKNFMAISEDVVDEEAKVSPVEDLPQPMLLLHPLIHQKLNH
jgi:hypothetical protein